MLDEAGVWPVHPKKSLKTAPHSLKTNKQKKPQRDREKCKPRNQHSTQKEETILLKHTALLAPMKREACAPETEELMCWV